MEHFLEGLAPLRHFKNQLLLLCKLSIKTKTNERIFFTRFVLSLSRWRESTANITISVEKMELILKFYRFLHHFWGSEGASWYIKSQLSQRWRWQTLAASS